MVHVLVFQVNFSASDGCQIVHGAATWCLLFRIDLYALSYVGAIDVVVWQREVNLSDSERYLTLHIAALWCQLNPLIRNSLPPGPCSRPMPRALRWSWGGSSFFWARYPCMDTSLCTGELNAIRKHKCFLCSPFYVKGVSLGHVGRN